LKKTNKFKLFQKFLSIISLWHPKCKIISVSRFNNRQITCMNEILLKAVIFLH